MTKATISANNEDRSSAFVRRHPTLKEFAAPLECNAEVRTNGGASPGWYASISRS